METVGSPLLSNIKKLAAKLAVEWAAHGNIAMQVQLLTTSIYGDSWQLRWAAEWAANGNFAMLIRLPTTSIYGYSEQLSGHPTTFQVWK